MPQTAIQPESLITALPEFRPAPRRDRFFQNPWPAPALPEGGRMLRWLLGRALRDRSGFLPTPRRELSAAELRTAEKQRVAAYLGHATVLLRLGADWVLTDPVLSNTAGPLPGLGARRLTAAPLGIADLPPIDTIVLSHDHYDHLDRSTVQVLERRDRPRFVVPIGLGPILRRWGVARVVELDWGQSVLIGDNEYSCLPARHFSGRWPHLRNTTLWSSWMIRERRSGVAVYFAGDTGYGPHFAQIARQFKRIDLALLPIGAYEPRWLMEEVHTTPAEALQAFLDLKARRMLAIHWGVFDLADESLDAPPALLLQAAAENGVAADRIAIPPLGGMLSL